MGREAKGKENWDLEGKLRLSHHRKISHMVKPTSIIQVRYFGGDWEVIKVLSQSLYRVSFLAKNKKGIILKFTHSSIEKYVKDASGIGSTNTNRKVRFANTYKSLRKLTLEDFIKECKEMKRVSSRKRQWLKMIHANKLTCPVTQEKVVYCSYDVTPHGSYHFNFYSESKRLFTVDHIIPKSKGGSPMKLKNLQPMIATHNWKKGSQDNEEFMTKIRNSPHKVK